MPRQKTSPARFPPFILSQIQGLAQHIVAARKARGHTQAQWAAQLGISQPTMARLERGDPSIATATYVMCLWLVNSQLDLLQLLGPRPMDTSPLAVPTTTNLPAANPAEEFAQLLASWSIPAL